MCREKLWTVWIGLVLNDFFSSILLVPSKVNTQWILILKEVHLVFIVTDLDNLHLLFSGLKKTDKNREPAALQL